VTLLTSPINGRWLAVGRGNGAACGHLRALIAPLLGRSLSQGHGASVIAIEDLGECGTVKVTRFKRHEVRGCKSSE
jgi:hypothetical protein